MRVARLAGGLYLAYIALTAVTAAMRGQVVVSDDYAATAENLAASDQLFRVAFVGEILAGILFLLAAWALYLLLSPVNRAVALLFLLLNAGGVAVQSLNMLNLWSAAAIVDHAGPIAALVGRQPEALAMLFVQMYEAGFIIAQFFYAAWLLPLGYLVLRSGFLPRLLGIILIVESAAWMLYPLQYFLAPELDWVVYFSSVVGFIGEFSLALWLLIKGAAEGEALPAQR